MAKLNTGIADLLSLGLMYVKKIHQFLSSTKKDAHKRKLVPFFLPHGVYGPRHKQANTIQNTGKRRGY